MSVLKILGRSNSINVRKVLWLCDELKLQYLREDWGRGFQSPQVPEYVALNPNATIPVLIDDDYVIWQSNSILRYLANQYAGEHLYPTHAKQRGQIDQWIDWQGIELNNSWSYALKNLIFQSPEHQEQTLVEKSIQDWSQHMHILNEQLAKTNAYVAGDIFTLADIPIGLSVQRWFLASFEHPDLPYVQQYYERLSQREAYLRWGNNGQI